MNNIINNHKPLRSLSAFVVLALLGMNALVGCMTDSEKETNFTTKKPYLFATASDYKTGAVYAYNLGTGFVNDSVGAIHSDAVVRYLGGDDIYVLNRLGRDNLMVYDKHSLKMVIQVPFPAQSNPYDIAVKDSLMYVAFYGLNKIGVYHQRDGKERGEIDLSAYADDGDKIPETTALLFIGNDLYAITGNMDTKNDYKLMQAHLLKIDVTARTVSKSLDLPYTNPRSLSFDVASGKIYVPCSGTLFDKNYAPVLDGGIVGVEASTLALKDTLATEIALGGTVNALVMTEGTIFMDLNVTEGINSEEQILAISIKDGKSKVVTKLEAYKLGGMAVDGPSGTLFVGDRKNGLKMFDLTTHQEKAGTKVEFKIPTTDLVIIR